MRKICKLSTYFLQGVRIFSNVTETDYKHLSSNKEYSIVKHVVVIVEVNTIIITDIETLKQR